MHWLKKILGIEPKKEEPDKKNDSVLEKYDIPCSYFAKNTYLSKTRVSQILENPLSVTPRDFEYTDDKGLKVNAMDSYQKKAYAFDSSAFNNQSLGNLSLDTPLELLAWYVSFSFVGYSALSNSSQHWAVNRACEMKGEDAVRNGFSLSIKEDIDNQKQKEIIDYLNDRCMDMRLTQSLVEAHKFNNVFGIRHVLFVVKKATTEEQDKYYKSKFNPSKIKKGEYKGIQQIDPHWMVPEITEGVFTDPTSMNYYNPEFWSVNGRLIHRSHFVILTGSEVPDILKPTYRFGGVSLAQKIMSRVYSAERSCDEAPQLLLTKRLLAVKSDFEKGALEPGQLEESLSVLSEFRDNYCVLPLDRDDDIIQTDTTLSDVPQVIMIGWQMTAAIAGIPIVKFLQTSPVGFNSSGTFETDSYNMSLETIQSNEFAPIVDKHIKCLVASELSSKFSVRQDLAISVQFNPVSTMTDKERAEVENLNASSAKILWETGAVDEADIRLSLSVDENSQFFGIEPFDDDDDDSVYEDTEQNNI